MIYGESLLKNVARKNQIHSIYSKQKLSYDLDYSFSKLLTKELEIARFADIYYRDLRYSSDFDVSILYEILNSDYQTGYIEGRSFRNFLTKNRILSSENEVNGLVRRFDIDKNGKIQFWELKGIFTSFMKYQYTSTDNLNKGNKSSMDSTFLDSSICFKYNRLIFID